MSSGNAAARPLPRHLLGVLLHPWTWRMAWRDSRSERTRLVIFSLSIIAGLAALVAIHALKASVESGLNTQAKSLLGSDLQISARDAISPTALTELRAKASRTSRETSFTSMLYFPSADAARLVEVRGLEGAFPFYGQVETEPADAWTRLPQTPGVLVEPALLDQFHAKLGDSVKLGGSLLPILGVVKKAPPGGSRMGSLAPGIFLNFAALARTGLLGTTNLASQHWNFEFPANVDAEPIKADLKKRFPNASWQLETPADRRESLGKALENSQQFLSIIALVALVLGAIGVAGSMHAHLTRRVPTIAILRCLGTPGALAFGIYFAQAMALALLGALLGAALGVTVHAGVLHFYRDQLPITLEGGPPWIVIAQTTAAGFALCGGFALLPLLRIGLVSPAATLRAGATLSARGGFWRALPVYAFLVALLLLLAAKNAADWPHAIGLVGGLGVAFGLLFGVAKLLAVLARRIVRPGWPYVLRQGIANLHRPQNQTLLFLLSLGLGTFLILTVLLTRNLIVGRLSLGPLGESPNVYLIDVQPDQLEGVRALLTAEHLPVLESAPMVTMRLTAVRGVPVADLQKQNRIPRWILQREFRSSYRDHLTASEKLIAGKLEPRSAEATAPIPLSLESGFARDLHVGLGDALTLDVQGVPLQTRVASLREVDWSKFRLNFFMIFPPGVLESAPGFSVVTTRIPPGGSSGELQRALVKKYPNVTALDLMQLLATVRKILEQASRVLTILAACTVAAALPIVIGTLLNGRDQRRRETVLLRTLGASARQLQQILLVEYLALGLLSALTGVLLALGAHTLLAHTIFDGPAPLDGRVLAAGVAIPTLIAVLGGLLLNRGLTRTSPLPILRGS